MVNPIEIDNIDSSQIYADSRSGEELLVVHEDGAIVLLRDRSKNHRLITRPQFEKEVGAGRYKLQKDAAPFEEIIDVGDERIDFEDLEAIGNAGAKNLRENGFETKKDVANATDEEILDIAWVGEKGLRSIRETVQ